MPKKTAIHIAPEEFEAMIRAVRPEVPVGEMYYLTFVDGGLVALFEEAAAKPQPPPAGQQDALQCPKCGLILNPPRKGDKPFCFQCREFFDAPQPLDP